MNVEQIKIEESWKEVLKPVFEKPYFQEIVSKLKEEKSAQKIIFPPGALIFNAFNLTPFNKVKVIILGQDPYHNIGQAMGLSFSVPKSTTPPPSLVNIFKELNADLGVPISQHGDLSHWAFQGVLLLNAILTVEANKPASHKNLGWEKFTDDVIETLSKEKTNLVFLLWGNFAKSKAKLIDRHKHLILESSHPSPLAGKAFFGNHHFSATNTYLTQHKLGPIDWNLT